MGICGTYCDHRGILSILITTVIQIIPYLLSLEFCVDSENDYSTLGILRLGVVAAGVGLPEAGPRAGRLGNLFLSRARLGQLGLV